MGLAIKLTYVLKRSTHVHVMHQTYICCWSFFLKNTWKASLSMIDNFHLSHMILTKLTWLTHAVQPCILLVFLSEKRIKSFVFLKFHHVYVQCISYAPDNVNMTYSCGGAVYIFCLSFWKTHKKLRFPTFEHVYVQSITYASDNVNLTYIVIYKHE